MDCYGDPKLTGKVGTDIEESKCGWLIVQALRKANPEQRIVFEVNFSFFNLKMCLNQFKILLEKLW